MTSSKAKPVGRAVKVQLIPVNRSPFSFDMWRESRRFLEDYKHPAGIIVTGAKIKSRTLKRLVEISAMDYDSAFLWLSNDGYSYSEAGVICGFLGLSGARKGRKAKT